MTTENQIEANKLNAQKSTGPRSASGKAKSARNSIKHGLRSRTPDILLSGEDTRQYNRFYKALVTDLDPVGPKETILADRIINFYWKLKRVSRMETSMFYVLSQRRLDTDPKFSQYRFHQLQKGCVPEHLTDAVKDIVRNALGYLAASNFGSHNQGGEHSLENIQNYESRIERSLYKAQLEFQKLQFIRRQKESQLQNEPNL